MAYDNGSSKRSLPNGLAAVALLKARFDEGVDHIDMFMPLVADTVANMPTKSFTCVEVQQLLGTRHGLAMPQYTLNMLLNRAARNGSIKREFGRYTRKSEKVTSNLQTKKAGIAADQNRLAEEFRKYAASRDHTIGSAEEALRLILGFLQDNQVAILLGAEEMRPDDIALTNRETRLVAEFAQHVMSTKSHFAQTLQEILEGLVVYRTAFLKDVTSPARQFKGLRVYFDTRILLQLLGYEGDALATLSRETLQLLKTADVQCLAFDKTVYECRGILRMYEGKLGSTQGARQLYPTPMTRHFLTKKYTPSDVRQMMALIPQELSSLGIQVAQMPKHLKQFTLDEKKLGEALADEHTRNVDEPRVIHDVDCVAGILTLRHGKESVSLSEVQAVFVTSTKRVLANVQRWYEEEGESGIGPVVHIRALSNLVWLRRPALAVNLKAHELVALCNAALQPSRKTWERFLEHLSALEKSRAITSDEAVAIVVSEMTDDLLSEVDDDAIDDNDVVDASTLDEIIDRVRSTYDEHARKKVAEAEANAQRRVDEAAKQLAEVKNQVEQHYVGARGIEDNTAEEYRRLKLAIEGRALLLARILGRTSSFFLALPVIVGAGALIIGHPIHGGFIGVTIGITLVVFVLMELFGILHHIDQLRARVETLTLPWLRKALGAEHPRPNFSINVLGLDPLTSDQSKTTTTRILK